MIVCKECGSLKVENRTLMLCASCNKLHRKTTQIKAFEPNNPIKKVSKERAVQNRVYSKIKQKVLFNAWCAYHGKPCIPTDIHHQMGRVGFADDKEIPLLIDVRYMIPVCRQAHDWITEHSKEATEQGYSLSRVGRLTT